MYAGIGWSYWQRYEQTKNPEYLELAIDMTQRALTIHVPHLDKHNPMDEEIICDIRNAIAWYLAARGKPEDKVLALACIEYLRQRMAKYEKHRKAWEDTCRFVSERYT